MSLTRKDFLTGSLALGAIAVLDGCGDSGNGQNGSGGAGGNGGDGGSSGAACTDGANGPSDLQHGHTIAILQADIDDPQDRTYTSDGGNHNHSVAVTAAELAELAANGTVTVMSDDTHAHTWMIICV